MIGIQPELDCTLSLKVRATSSALNEPGECLPSTQVQSVELKLCCQGVIEHLKTSSQMYRKYQVTYLKFCLQRSATRKKSFGRRIGRLPLHNKHSRAHT